MAFDGQILTVAQMVAAEQALIAAGTSVDALMRTAGRGAGEWVWRLTAGRPVTLLCGPGNNGGDGYVIAELIRERGGAVTVLAMREPATDAARNARTGYGGEVLPLVAPHHGGALVDCLFGSGLNRGLPEALVAALAGLAERHDHTVAVDLPSGIESDSGAVLNRGLPANDLTIALGAWKFAHWTMPAAATMGTRRLVDIGVTATPGAVRLLARPRLEAPGPAAHKYTRGLLAVVAGTMPGAALLACTAAQRSGAGYVKLLSEQPAPAVPHDLVVDRDPLAEALADPRIAAVLVGPGLGGDAAASARLSAVLAAGKPLVLDADALILLRRADAPLAHAVVTPHEAEMAALERTFGITPAATRRERAAVLAGASGAVVLLKGSDTVVAAPDGRLRCAPPGSSWLSTAGSGDVLAGMIGSRLASGADPFAAAAQGLWLHGEAARLAGPAFAAGELAGRAAQALASALA
ncbi:MAG: NAD(P)H-hydrate dehydratase [Novosphingobium sp.]